MSNAALLFRRSRTAQPQSALKINWLLQPKFIFLGSAGGLGANACTGIGLGQVNGSHLAKKVVAEAGLCLMPGGTAPYASGLGAYLPAAFILSLGQSLVWVGRFIATDATYNTIASRYGTTTESAYYAGQWRLEVSPSNQLVLLVRNNSGVTVSVGSGLTVPLMVQVTISVKILDGAVNFSVNGVSAQVSTAAVPQTSAGGGGNDQRVTIGTPHGGGYRAHRYAQCAVFYGLSGDVPENPWGIFRRRRHLFPSVGSGASALNASGTAQAGGTADLTAQVALEAVGIATASGSAGLTVAVPLSAVGFAVSSGTANAVATVTITAAGFAQAAGSAGLSAALLLQGAGAAQAAGNAALAAQLNALASGAAQASGTANLSGGAPGELSASDGAVASGTAVLSVTVGLTASGSGVASGMASLSGGAAGQVAAVGGAQSGGSAVLRATVSLTAAGFVQAMGAGYLTLSLPFSGFAPLKMAAAHQRLNHLSISAVAASRLASNSRRLSQLRSEVSHG